MEERRVPGRHHRGVDRTVAILENVAHSRTGLSLSEIARRLDAPVSSIQGLTNGLVATGYLIEEARRYLLGPGAYALTMGADWSLVAPVSHRLIEELAQELGCALVVGMMVGDSLVYFDEVGEDPLVDFYAKSRSRRPLLTSSGGKCLLAALPDPELNQRLRELSASHPSEQIDAFLSELPEIRRTGLARGWGIPDTAAIAAGVPGRSGRIVAAVIAAGPDHVLGPRLDDIGTALLERIRQFYFHDATQAPHDARLHGAQGSQG
jgi:DNA-binding IclR family transcriptional regulator